MGTVLLDPWDNPDAYTFMSLDGLISPGPCGLTADARRALKIEVQQSIGFTGAFLMFRGEELPKLAYKLRLWTAEHFKNAGPFIDILIEGYKKRLNRVLKLDDQSLVHLGITKAVVVDIGELKQTKQGEIPHEINFTLQAYQKRKSVQGPPRGPKTEIEKELDAAREETAGLRRELDAAEQAAAKGK